jgi:hypothetical protein
MMSELGVQSLIDVGCGKGFSSKFFLDHGARVTCVEGSRDAVKQSLLPAEIIVNHDVSLGPWWPEQTFDVAWSTEFVEHVGRQYMQNYMPIFKKSALIMITTVGWGGWHHVEVHGRWWWIARMEAQGFVYSDSLTDSARQQVMTEATVKGTSIQALRGILVFINPAVASLPAHQHLIGGNGCDSGSIDNRDGGLPCVGIDALPVKFQSILECGKKKNGDTPWEHIMWDCQKPAAKKQ